MIPILLTSKKRTCKFLLRHLLLTVPILISFAFPSAAKNLPESSIHALITIHGHITDETGNPLAGAILAVKWTDREIFSDQNGEFKIENITEKDTIVVNYSGYQSTQFRMERSKLNYFITLKTATASSSLQAVSPNDTRMDIKGKVFDDRGIALPDAILIVKGQNQGGSTNSNGEFALAKVPVNSTIIISHVSFFPDEFTIKKSESTYHRTLQKSAIHLDEIVVVGYGLKGDAQKVAEKDVAPESSGNGFAIVEQNPEFPGGKEALYRFLAQNIKYPASASRNKITGNVFVSFTVNENGNIREPEVIRKLGFGIDEEVLRVVQSMPNWNPAKQQGKPVSKKFTLPVHFSPE
jgi:TonB family protein